MNLFFPKKIKSKTNFSYYQTIPVNDPLRIEFGFLYFILLTSPKNKLSYVLEIAGNLFLTKGDKPFIAL